jgi:hypothetical protein
MEEYSDGKDNPFFSFVDELGNFFASAAYTGAMARMLRHPG